MAPKKVKATSPGGKPRSVQGRVQAWLVLLIWAPAIFYRERLAFSLAGASCQWPSLDGGDGAQSTGDLPPVRIAVVADPQLTTHLSYRELGRGTPGLTAVEAISDAYMSRAFRKAVLTNDPDHVLFLGDLIDQGENIADPAEWHEARRRFDRIFRWPRNDPSGDEDDGAGVDAELNGTEGTDVGAYRDACPISRCTATTTSGTRASPRGTGLHTRDTSGTSGRRTSYAEWAAWIWWGSGPWRWTARRTLGPRPSRPR